MPEEVVLNLTPDPKVLIALTHADIKPYDALCELVDNAIDSFSSAVLQGVNIVNPCVRIDLPTLSDINNGRGLLRVADNGPGLDMQTTEKALRAGFSGNNAYDSLGLFGMGFNISTGKIGSVTKFHSSRKDSNRALEVTIDLNKINYNKDYNVVAYYVDKKPETHGTIIEISNWWPNGNDNRDFVKNLVNYGAKTIREELGRRYATILRERNIKIFVNDVECVAFEHCVWGDQRYVERSKHGRIPAVFRFDKVVFTQKKCANCAATLESFQNVCPACGSHEIRTLEERIYGWVGIQRFDSLTEFGVDLIRNGRAIRKSEKSAFFEYMDDFQKTTKDYPIDSIYGRIVGEVHLDYVPVDFMKQDFQRSSSEWHRAMVFLRGESSLQPTSPGADQNVSPIFKLYQGYRKVKTAGKTDMYMGVWDPVKEEPRRISRDVEKEFYEKFKKREPGYYDDTEWWKKVEEADKKPVKKLPLCPKCGCQNLEDAEKCATCGAILKAKTCIFCGEEILQSAIICPKCGKPQIAKVIKPWVCSICGTSNDPSFDNCKSCGAHRGEENHLTFDYLKKHSDKNDSLSIADCSIKLADGTNSNPIQVNVFDVSEPIKSNQGTKSLPIFIDKTDLSTLSIFINPNHRIFKQCKLKPEQMIAEGIAEFLIMTHRSINVKDGTHSTSYIAWQIIEKYWADRLDGSENDLKVTIDEIFFSIKEKLICSNAPELPNYFDLLDSEEQKEFINEMINAGDDISKVSEYKAGCKYLKYVPASFLVKLFDLRPDFFFDGKVWNEAYNLDVGENFTSFMQERTKALYKGCLDDLFFYLKYKSTDYIIIQRTLLAVELLKGRMTE